MITAKDVTDYLDLDKGEADPFVQKPVDATNALVSRLPDINTVDVDGVPTWAADTKLGAIMLAARLYTRRNSPNGIEALNEGGATYVSRYDSDIARMLNIDQHAYPRVG